MSEVKFYQLTLELNSRLNKNKVSFIKKLPDVVDAKNKFNASLEGSKYLVILSLTQCVINLILRLDNHPAGKNVGIRTISRFINILQDELNWKTYLDADVRGIFKASSIRLLDIKECKTLANALYGEGNEIFNSSDIKKLFDDIEDAAEGKEPKDDDFKSTTEECMTSSLEDALGKIDSLTGLDTFKREIRNIVRFAEVNKRIDCKNSGFTFPHHYLFKGENGLDMLAPARLMAEVFYHLGIIKNRRFAMLDVREASSEYYGINIENYVDEPDIGFLFIENIFDSEEENVDDKKVLDKITEKMQQLRGNVLVILSYYMKDDKGFTWLKLKNALDAKVSYRQIDFPFYNENELHQLVERAALAKGCGISAEAVEIVREEINSSKTRKGFKAENAADNMVGSAFTNKVFSVSEADHLDIQKLLHLDAGDFDFLNRPSVTVNAGKAPTDELAEMIGLSDVKSRVRQICSVITARSRKNALGIQSKPVCLHMQFTGNPGTGKTTVARILGRVLKDLGFLSSGHFIEITRNDLIGEYIGQTTPKVRRALKRAKGGIMFIDEAYSLYQSSENDYGHEAVAELVKGMEDLKDDLVVIFAGYPKEMEKMVKMNPGLKDRIAFTIEFPDYSTEELNAILLKMCNENAYTLTLEGQNKLNELIKLLYSNKNENFGNARIIRKIFERLEIYQNCRVCSADIFDREELMQINLEDVLQLYEDSEIAKILKANCRKSLIGFRQCG